MRKIRPESSVIVSHKRNSPSRVDLPTVLQCISPLGSAHGALKEIEMVRRWMEHGGCTLILLYASALSSIAQTSQENVRKAYTVLERAWNESKDTKYYA